MATRRRDSPLAEQILETLEQQGYRSTAPRRLVVRAVAGQERHFTAEGLYGHLPGLGRATIYRSLKILVETGVICRVLLEDGHLHYQLSHRGHHHHLLCVECGASQDLLGCEIGRRAGQHIGPPRIRDQRALAGSLRQVPRLRCKRDRSRLISFLPTFDTTYRLLTFIDT